MTSDSAADAIVIGSGIGGLTTATLLARLYGRRVLVLEQHNIAGGFTHTFARPGGWSWDIGVHYVGRLHVDGIERDTMSVVTGGQVEWQVMPDPFERIVFPGFEFAIRRGREAFEADLVSAFPGDSSGIGRYLRDIRRAASFMGDIASRGLAPSVMRAAMRSVLSERVALAKRTTRSYLEETLHTPEARAVLGARWQDFGLPPGKSAFLAHSIIANHYLEGASYPVGSARVIAASARNVIEASGGELRTGASVEQIQIEGGRAVGVRLASGEELRAPVIVSDAGARNTFLRLLPGDIHLPFSAELKHIEPGLATVTAYLGLRRSARELGVSGENFWLHTSLDHDAMFERRNEAALGSVSSAYLSFPSLKDPSSTRDTAEIMTAIDSSVFEPWRGTAWRHRGEEYEQLKTRILDGLLSIVERRLPGFRELVVTSEVSTPLTNEYFSRHPFGEIYGLPFTPERASAEWLQPRTIVPGLFLTGADALVPGVVGAMMGGAFATAVIEGASALGRVRREARKLRRSVSTPERSVLSTRVASRNEACADVVVLELEASSDEPALPSWQAGAHIDVYVPGGPARQYSLTGGPSAARRYRIAIAVGAEGSASRALCAHAKEGMALKISRPRQHFPLVEDAAHVALIAGGIGVTPTLAMAYRLRELQRSFHLHVCYRDEARALFVDEMRSAFGERLTLHVSSLGGRLDVGLALAALPAGSVVYVCGPASLQAAVRAAATAACLPASRVRSEAFEVSVHRDEDRAFEVELARTRCKTTVEKAETITQALERVGVYIPTACTVGVCGTCALRVLEGLVDHRDSVLTEAESKGSKRIITCVSRARSDRLVLDL